MKQGLHGGSRDRLGTASHFMTTRWTMLKVAAGEGEDAESALQWWCSSYRGPVFAYVLARVRNEHLAEDLTQEFFLKFLAKELLARPVAERGKFRSFLLTVLKRFLMDEAAKAAAQKRGGRAEMLSLEEMPNGGPANPQEEGMERFDRDWARQLMDGAFTALRNESDPARFDLLKGFLEREAEAGEYQALAPAFGGNPNTVSAAVRRLRLRLREKLREEVRRTVGSSEEVEEELSYLLKLILS